MTELARNQFYNKIKDAPLAAQGFFETVVDHFHQRNGIIVHFTETNGGDLRLAIPREVLGKKKIRNFATMYWQPRNEVIFSRINLTPKELSVFGFDGAVIPTAESEPLKSDVRLFENDWQHGTRLFIRALESAKMKLLPK